MKVINYLIIALIFTQFVKTMEQEPLKIKESEEQKLSSQIQIRANQIDAALRLATEMKQLLTSLPADDVKKTSDWYETKISEINSLLRKYIDLGLSLIYSKKRNIFDKFVQLYGTNFFNLLSDEDKAKLSGMHNVYKQLNEKQEYYSLKLDQLEAIQKESLKQTCIIQ